MIRKTLVPDCKSIATTSLDEYLLFTWVGMRVCARQLIPRIEKEDIYREQNSSGNIKQELTACTEYCPSTIARTQLLSLFWFPKAANIVQRI